MKVKIFVLSLFFILLTTSLVSSATTSSSITTRSSSIIGVVMDEKELVININTGSGTDTNETTRFNTLVGTDCGGTDKMVGVDATGLVVCDSDAGGSGGNTTQEVWIVVDNSTFVKFTDENAVNISWQNITNFPTCGGTDKLAYNGSHLICDSDAGGSGGNTTAEIQAVEKDPNWEGNYTAFNDTWSSITNLSYLTSYTEVDLLWSANFTNMQVGCPDSDSYVYDIYPNGTFACAVDTGGSGGNTTQEIVDAINNTDGTWNITVNTSTSWGNNKIANTTQFETEADGTLSIVLGWFSDAWGDIWDTKTSDDLTEGTTNLYENNNITNHSYLTEYNITNSTYSTNENVNQNTTEHETDFKHGNTTAEIQAVSIDTNCSGDGSCDLVVYEDDSNRVLIVYENITNFPTCGVGEFFTSDGTALTCDASGGGGAGGSKWTDNGTFLQANSSFADNLYVSGWINSTDWKNVSIVEAQITDLTHTIDTVGQNSTFQGNYSSVLNTTIGATHDNVIGNQSGSINDTFAGNYSITVNTTTLESYATHDNVLDNVSIDNVGQNSTFTGANYSTNVNTTNIQTYGYYNSSLVNSTQFEEEPDGTLTLLWSWVNSWFSSKTTDDLSEGTTNLYENNNITNDSYATHDNVNENKTGSTNDTWVGNQTRIETNIEGNGSLQWHDQDLNTTNDVFFNNINISGNLSFHNVTFYRAETDESIAGEVWCSEMDGPGNGPLPHFCIQSGGPTQASFVARSFMIVNEDESILNNTNRTDCGVWADSFGEPLKIDCNTTTTGADLLVGDDMQVFGDVWLIDSDGEWHFTTRELQLNDEMRDETVISRVNSSLTGLNFSILEKEGETIVINLEEQTFFLNSSDWILLTAGTNTTPQFNHIYYNNVGDPQLTKATTEQNDKADVGQFLIGDNYDYGSIAGSATNFQFIRKVYRRFFDDGAVYKSGFNISVETTSLNFSQGVLKVLLDDFDIALNHTTRDISVEIHTDGTFHQHLDGLDNYDTYATGGAISNNKYFNLVCGIGSTLDMEGRMYCVIQDEPPIEFIRIIDAETDQSFVNFFPNNAFVKKLFIPVARVVIQRAGGTNTIQTLSTGNLFLDLRGTVTGGGSPPTPGITSHTDLTNLEWNDALHTFNDANQVMDIGSHNLTTSGNISSSWFFGNLNWSWVQNAPVFSLATDVIDWINGNKSGVRNDTFAGNYSTNINNSVLDAQGYYNSTLTNVTQFEEQAGGFLGLKWSWFTSAWDSIFSTKTTDDLTEGTTNLYNNNSWNETGAREIFLADGIKRGNTTAEIFGVVDNSSFLKTEVNWNANYSTNVTCISRPDCLSNITYNGSHSIWR